MTLSWPEARQLFDLDPAVSHLNHGSFGAVPSAVLRAQGELRQRMASNPNGFFRRELPELVVRARQEAAEIIGSRIEDLALLTNTTEGVAAVLRSLDLRRGDEIIVTDHVYGGVSAAVRAVADRTGAKPVRVDLEPEAATDPRAVADAVEVAITPSTRIAILERITSPTALELTLDLAIQSLQRAQIPVLIDGAHAPGMVDVAVNTYGATWWVGNFHKWTCAPPGSACLWSSPQGSEWLQPAVLSWFTDEGFPDSFRWTGTSDQLARLCLPEVRKFMDEINWSRVRSFSHDLLLEFRARIIEMGLNPIGSGSGQMASFHLPRGLVTTQGDADSMMVRLAEMGCEVAVSVWRDNGLLRISTHCYNSSEDIDLLVTALEGELSPTG